MRSSLASTLCPLLPKGAGTTRKGLRPRDRTHLRTASNPAPGALLAVALTQTLRARIRHRPLDKPQNNPYSTNTRRIQACISVSAGQGFSWLIPSLPHAVCAAAVSSAPRGRVLWVRFRRNESATQTTHPPDSVVGFRVSGTEGLGTEGLAADCSGAEKKEHEYVLNRRIRGVKAG